MNNFYMLKSDENGFNLFPIFPTEKLNIGAHIWGSYLRNLKVSANKSQRYKRRAIWPDKKPRVEVQFTNTHCCARNPWLLPFESIIERGKFSSVCGGKWRIIKGVAIVSERARERLFYWPCRAEPVIRLWVSSILQAHHTHQGEPGGEINWSANYVASNEIHILEHSPLSLSWWKIKRKGCHRRLLTRVAHQV
jgi:hypothetical protein